MLPFLSLRVLSSYGPPLRGARPLSLTGRPYWVVSPDSSVAHRSLSLRLPRFQRRKRLLSRSPLRASDHTRARAFPFTSISPMRRRFVVSPYAHPSGKAATHRRRG